MSHEEGVDWKFEAIGLNVCFAWNDVSAEWRSVSARNISHPLVPLVIPGW